jgi:hypothetical protein
MGRAFRPPRSGTCRVRALPQRFWAELARGYSERITWAGLPTAITLAGRSPATTAPAPTTVCSPMLTQDR